MAITCGGLWISIGYRHEICAKSTKKNTEAHIMKKYCTISQMSQDIHYKTIKLTNVM